jgi:excisionase family DNA binding protein
MSADHPRFLSLADVAGILNVTTRQVYALVRGGDLRGIQVGGRNIWRVEAVELEDYIQRQYARTAPAADAAPAEKDVRSR